MNLNEAITREQALPPGSYRVQFDLTEPADINAIREALKEVDTLGINQWQSGGLWHLGVSYRKSAPTSAISFLPQAIVPLIAFAIAATIVTISIFRIKDITESLAKLALVVGVVAITLLALSRKPAR